MKCTIVIIALIAVAPLSFAGCAVGGAGNQPKAQTTVVQSTENIPDAPLEVQTENGAVEVIVSGESEEVTIEATITCTGTTQQEADQRLAAVTIDVSRGTGRKLNIRPVFPDKRRSSEGVRFVIRMPSVRDVTITTSNGAISVTNTAGTLNARSSNGRIEVTDHDGPAMLETSNGRITAKSIGGAIEAHTSNGDITAALADDATGFLKLDSSNGTISATVPSQFAGTIRCDTSNGKITVDDPAQAASTTIITRTHGEIVIGEGPESTIETSNGSIHITIGGTQ